MATVSTNFQTFHKRSQQLQSNCILCELPALVKSTTLQWCA